MGKSVNPYKVLSSYEEIEQTVFFGRKQETEQLLKLVEKNFLTVLYGKSGIGKTSLLQAGLFPQLRTINCLPIPIRLDYTGDAPNLLAQIHQAILNEINDFDIHLKTKDTDEPAEPLAPDETLWRYFQRVCHYDPSGEFPQTVTLVFDQFEEIFTRGKEHRTKEPLIKELHWLIKNIIPPSPPTPKNPVPEENQDKNRSFISKGKPDVRIIISLREDYLADFNDLKARFDSPEQGELRLIHLNGTRAREIMRALGGPWNKDLVNQILQLFYQGDIKDIKPGKTIPDEKLEIEPAILSLICHQLYEKQEQDLISITLKDKHKILQEFYDSNINRFPKKVEYFIEDNLLTKGGFRTIHPLPKNLSLKEHVLQLEEERILRREFWGGKECIEIIHDILVPVIIEKKGQRSKKKTFKWIVILSTLLVIFIALWVFAFYQNKRANQELKNVQELVVTSEALLELPRDNTKAVRIAQQAFKKGQPTPHERTYQVLGAIGYSSLERPFKITGFKHKGAIYSAVISPRGSHFLTASDDHTAKLWGLEQKPPVILKHDARVFSAVFSPDGNRILTASWDKTAKLWDLQGNLQTEFKGHKGAVTSALFSPDGSKILTVSRDNTAKLWDLKGNLKIDLDKHKNSVATAVFSPDGSKILTASWDNTAVLWNLDREPLFTIQHQGAVSSAVFSPDGQMILTASWDRTAKLLDLKGNLLAEYKGHKEAVTTALFAPSGNKVLTGSRDNTVKLWNFHGELTANLKHNEVVEAINFSPHGGKIVTSSRDGIVKVWDQDGTPLLELKKFNGIVYSARFSPDGHWLLTACEDGTADVWALNSNLLVDLNKHKNAVTCAVFSPDNTKALTASEDHSVKIWSSEGKLLADLNIHKDLVTSAVFSPDGSKILTASYDRTAKIWDSQGIFLQSLEKHRDIITSALFSSDSKKVITASEDGTAKVWDLQGKILTDLSKHQGAPVRSAVFSPDGRLVLTASVDKTAKVCDMQGKILAKLAKHTDVVNSARFSPNGRYIVTASRDGTAKLWDMDENLLANFEHKGPVFSAGFSPDNRRILTASEDGTAKLWNLKGQLLADLDQHKKPVTAAIFSPDGTRIITASYDHTAKLWNLQGHLLADLNMHRDIVTFTQFSPDGEKIITASKDGTAKIWLTPKAIFEWLKKAKIQSLAP